MTGKKVNLNDVEQYLQDAKVYRNGLTDRVCHMDSYMTVIDFPSLDKALKECPFSKEEMLSCCEEWDYFSYLSPIIKLTAILVRKHYN